MNNQTFKDIRLWKQMTQREFAAWLDVSLATVAMIEIEQRRVTDNIQSRIAHRFEVTDDFIQYQKRKNKLII